MNENVKWSYSPIGKEKIYGVKLRNKAVIIKVYKKWLFRTI